MPGLAKHQNADGTWNGVTMFAELTGLSEGEIRWTFERIKALLDEGKTKAEAKAIVAEECKGKPWL